MTEVLAVGVGVGAGDGVSHEGAGVGVLVCCMVLLVKDGLFVNSSSSIALLNGGVVARVDGDGLVTVSLLNKVGDDSVNELLKIKKLFLGAVPASALLPRP